MGLSRTIQPSISPTCCIMSILNQPLNQLTEMLSGKLYALEGYQTFFWIWLKTFTLILVPQLELVTSSLVTFPQHLVFGKVCPRPSTVSCGYWLDFRPSITGDGHYSWTLSLHWSCLCWSASSRQCPPIIQRFCCSTGFKVTMTKTKFQNVGAGEPPLTILIDGVPVEGVEEFVYLDSKQSSNGYMCYVRLGLPAQWWIFCRECGNAALSISTWKYTCTKHW